MRVYNIILVEVRSGGGGGGASGASWRGPRDPISTVEAVWLHGCPLAGSRISEISHQHCRGGTASWVCLGWVSNLRNLEFRIIWIQARTLGGGRDPLLYAWLNISFYRHGLPILEYLQNFLCWQRRNIKTRKRILATFFLWGLLSKRCSDAIRSDTTRLGTTRPDTTVNHPSRHDTLEHIIGLVVSNTSKSLQTLLWQIRKMSKFQITVNITVNIRIPRIFHSER